MRALLAETGRLLATHLHLFTLISLTVWLPAHVLRNYLEFFGPEDRPAAQSLQVLLTVQLVFDPLVVSASLAALVRIKQGLPVGYAIAMTEGLAAWARLMLVRFVVNTIVALPGFAGLTLGTDRSSASIVLAAALTAVAFVCIALLVRFAVIDSVVVLERRTVVTGWSRAAVLTAGHRWSILWTLVVLFSLVMALFAFDQFTRAVPDLNHFVARVLLDCALTVAQSVFTIALFLWYWRAREARALPAPVPLAPAT